MTTIFVERLWADAAALKILPANHYVLSLLLAVSLIPQAYFLSMITEQKRKQSQDIVCCYAIAYVVVQYFSAITALVMMSSY